MTRILAILIAILLASSGSCFAGSQKEFSCRQCGLKGTYGTGGGFFFEEILCFCTEKNHIVSVTWKRGKRTPKPVRIEGGIAVFKCPDSGTPTARQWDEKECPKCGSKRILIRATGLIYD